MTTQQIANETDRILDQIARLDARLGVGVGATRERARLLARLEEISASGTELHAA